MQRECGCAAVPTSDEFCGHTTFFNWTSALCGRILFTSIAIIHTPRSDFPPHVDIQNIYQIRAETYNASARRLLPATLLERWLQACGVTITFDFLRTTSFVSTKTNWMKSFVNSIMIALNSHDRLNTTQPCLKVSFSNKINV